MNTTTTTTTTTTTQANINVQTMRELLAESDSDNFDLADLHLLFLHGFKGYNHMSDEEVIDTYNTVFDD